MSSYLIQGAVEEGLIYGLVALGLFISYHILNIADMTTDGSFVLGAAVSSVLTQSGHPVVGLVLGLIAGGLAGLVTGFMQTKLNIPSILAGIITMTGLYTVNLLVQGGVPNLYYPTAKTVFSSVEKLLGPDYRVLGFLLIVVLVVIGAMVWFFSTKLGLSIRATGDNLDMVQASSINPSFTIMVGLFLSNSLTALGGALLAQKNTQGDINIGTGVVVIGLAGLVLGRVMVPSRRILFGALGTLVGSVIYRIIFSIALRYTPDPGYLKIVSAFIVAAVLAYPTVKKYVKDQSRRKRGGGHA